MRKFVLGAVLAAASVASPALAADLTDAKSTVEFMSRTYVADLLKEIGAQDVTIERDGDYEYIRFKNGPMPFNIEFAACEAAGCYSIVLMAGFDPGETRYPADLFNAFNKEHPFVTAVRLDGNKYSISRMVVAEGGITKQNLALNIAVFAAVPEVIIKYLNSHFVADAGKPNASPFQTVSAEMVKPVALSPAEIATIRRLHAKLPDPALKVR